MERFLKEPSNLIEKKQRCVLLFVFVYYFCELKIILWWQVAALRELKKEELVGFFNDHVKVNAPQKKILSIQVYGGLHSAEYETIVQNAPPPPSCEITDIYSFRRSRPLYGSFRGGVGQMKL
jgi:hypothetical protein